MTSTYLVQNKQPDIDEYCFMLNERERLVYVTVAVTAINDLLAKC